MFGTCKIRFDRAKVEVVLQILARLCNQTDYGNPIATNRVTGYDKIAAFRQLLNRGYFTEVTKGLSKVYANRHYSIQFANETTDVSHQNKWPT